MENTHMPGAPATRKTFELTIEECHLIISACGCAKSKLREYIEAYKKMGATECVVDCFSEINKYNKLQEFFNEIAL